MSYHRNLAAVTVACFVGFAGFTLVMPFLPLYFVELGVTDVGEVALWSGISLGVTPAVTALCAPFWGRLADRWGPKVLVLRSLLSFVVVMTALGFVTRPWHVFALRTFQGLVAGYGVLALMMAADIAPPGRLAQSIGIVQMAQRLGPALGPVIGGVIAQAVGLRRAFVASALCYLVAAAILGFGYREGARQRQPTAAPSERVSFRDVLALQNLFLLLGVILGAQFVDRATGPILPLYVASLGIATTQVPLVAGISFTLAAGGGALGNYVAAGLLSKMRPRGVIVGAAALGGLSGIVPAVVADAPVLMLMMVLLGLATGVAMTAAYTAAVSQFPEEARGVGFGFLTTASLTGMAMGPIASGFLGATSIRGVFVLNAVALVVLAIVVSRVMIERGLRAEGPVTEDS